MSEDKNTKPYNSPWYHITADGEKPTYVFATSEHQLADRLKEMAEDGFLGLKGMDAEHINALAMTASELAATVRGNGVVSFGPELDHLEIVISSAPPYLVDIKAMIGRRCMAKEDGQKVYDRIHGPLAAGTPIILDFTGVDQFSGSFFNYAVGQLFANIWPGYLDGLLHVRNITQSGAHVVRRVIENALGKQRASIWGDDLEDSASDSGSDWQQVWYSKDLVLEGAAHAHIVTGLMHIPAVELDEFFEKRGSAMNKEEVPEDIYDDLGYDPDNYARDGYGKDGYDANDYDRMGYDRRGYNREGFDRAHYNDKGYDAQGKDREGYDADGLDSTGHDRQGTPW